MSNMVVIIKTKEYIIKKAKPISNASQVYLNKKFIDSYMNLIPLNNVENIDFIEKCDDYFQITLEINCIYRKKAKARGRGAYCYLPLEFAGEDILIFEAPY